MERAQFTFYESFYKAVQRIRDIEVRAAAYDVICAYALYGEMPDLDTLPDAVALAFELIKPNLDASRKKAESGKRGGMAGNKQVTGVSESSNKHSTSKPEANNKQTESTSESNDKHPVSEKENEKEKEKEKENEIEKEYKCNNLDLVVLPARERDPELARVVNAYTNMINPTPSQSCLEELQAFAEEMGADVVIEACNVALDEKKTTWSYIRAILRNYHTSGVRCLADIQRIRDEREKAKSSGSGSNTARHNNGQKQRHGQSVSPLGKQAIQKMLEEDSG